ALPVAFKPVKIDGKTYYDGGILDNTPYKPLLDAGCDEIIIIDLFRFNFRRKRQIEDTRMLYFYPSKSIRGVMDFSHEQITRRFELGYHDTFERLKEIEEEDRRLQEKEKEKEKRTRLKRIREAEKTHNQSD
ncbi:MAG: patatin-like phospholipase family protein, partial [Bacillota bacterium]